MRRPRPFRGVPDTQKEMKDEGCEDERCCGGAGGGDSSRGCGGACQRGLVVDGWGGSHPLPAGVRPVSGKGLTGGTRRLLILSPNSAAGGGKRSVDVFPRYSGGVVSVDGEIGRASWRVRV